MGQHIIIYNFKNLFSGFSAFFTRSFLSWWQGVFGKLFHIFALFQIFIENQEAMIFAVCILLHDKVVDSLEEMLVVLRCIGNLSNTSTSKKNRKRIGIKKALSVSATNFDTQNPTVNQTVIFNCFLVSLKYFSSWSRLQKKIHLLVSEILFVSCI